MYHDYFYPVNLPTDIISDINDFIKLNDDNFFISKLGQCRLNFNSKLIIKLSEFIPFIISDCGVFKNIPGWNYPIHKDKIRQCALNMLLSDDTDDFHAISYDDQGRSLGKIPYVKNQWLLLNTKKFHSVKNDSLTMTRYMVSIGCIKTDYYSVRDQLLSN